MAASTIVTACDGKFLWGAFLLLVSLKRHRVSSKVKVWASGLDDSDHALLRQFEGVEVVAYDTGFASVPLEKPAAILSTNTDYVTWMDSDCMVTGDISACLSPSDQRFQIRFRSPSENRLRFRSEQYGPHDAFGSIPEAVLEVWKQEVNEREKPMITTTCVSNCFTLHQRHFEFMWRWRDQIQKIILKYGGESDSPYTYGGRISDELTLNSLLAFAYGVPPMSPYPLDKNPHAYLIHFGVNPKPWNRWQPKHLKHHELVLSSIDWARQRGYRTPDVPPAFRRSRLITTYAAAYGYEMVRTVVNQVRGS